ncbi:histone-like nucleoid-structuring protein Lsr2 [Actinophytocola sediminis]
MAQKTVLELVDDLDGGPADETVAFAIDGVEFVIDLSADNAARLRDVLAEFVGNSRRTGGRRTARAKAAAPAPAAAAVAVAVAPAPATNGKPDTQAVREWARSQGETVAERGRVPQALLIKFQEAHA